MGRLCVRRIVDMLTGDWVEDADKGYLLVARSRPRSLHGLRAHSPALGVSRDVRRDLLSDVGTVGERLDCFRRGVRLIGMALHDLDLLLERYDAGAGDPGSSRVGFRAGSNENVIRFLCVEPDRHKREQSENQAMV